MGLVALIKQRLLPVLLLFTSCLCLRTSKEMRKKKKRKSSDAGRLSMAARCLLPLSAILCVAVAAAAWRFLLSSSPSLPQEGEENQKGL